MDSKTCTVKIVTNGAVGRIYVDSVDMTNGCCGYEITHRAGEPPRVILELTPTELEIEGKGAVVEHA